MQRSPNVQSHVLMAPSDAPSHLAENIPSKNLRDRSAPAWARTLSFIFTFGTETCFISVIVLLIFFQSMVAINGEVIFASLLPLISLAPIFGLIIFELAHSKALAGHRRERDRNKVTTRAVIGVLLGLILGFIHPLLGIPLLISLIMSVALAWVCNRYLTAEPVWDFLPQEGVSILIGRDQYGLHLANEQKANHALLKTSLRAISWLSLIGAAATSSWLAANGILNVAAIATVVFLTFWSQKSFNTLILQRSPVDHAYTTQSNSVTSLPAPEGVDLESVQNGLIIRNLSAFKPDGNALLSNVSFELEPGSVVGLCGGSFAGKSLLMNAIANPFGLSGLEVRGFIRMCEIDPWRRYAYDQEVSVVYVPPESYIIPGNGMQNLSCFGDDIAQERAHSMLKKIVLTSDTVEQISKAKNARHLSSSEKKALSFARALHLHPKLILLDRPEDGASEKLLTTFASRINQERRLGTSFIIATENRALLEMCDKLLMMQNGRIVDFGPTHEIQEKLSAGWNRFVTERSLDNEEALDDWLCAQFRRDGDESNRRAVCMVANEMLALCCKERTFDGPDESVRFEFKHFENYCLLRMLDDATPISSGTLQKAQENAAKMGSEFKSDPLVEIMKGAMSVDATVESNLRVLQVQIETYDPRRGPKPAEVSEYDVIKP